MVAGLTYCWCLLHGWSRGGGGGDGECMKRWIGCSLRSHKRQTSNCTKQRSSVITCHCNDQLL